MSEYKYPAEELIKLMEKERDDLLDRTYGYVPNYPKPFYSDHINPYDLIEGNENKLY